MRYQRRDIGSRRTFVVCFIHQMRLHVSPGTAFQNDDFGRSTGLLGGAMKRLKVMSSKGGNTMCYMMMFSCFVFLVLWWLIR